MQGTHFYQHSVSFCSFILTLTGWTQDPRRIGHVNVVRIDDHSGHSGFPKWTFLTIQLNLLFPLHDTGALSQRQ